MRRAARFIVGHPERIFGLTALITILAIVALFRIQFNADIAGSITEGSERGEAFAALEEKYDAADPVNVVLSLPDGRRFTERAALIELARFRDELGALDGVVGVAALVPSVSPVDGTVLTPELIAELPLPVVQGAAAGPLADLLLSEDQQHTLLMVTPVGDGIDTARTIKELSPPEGMELTVAGNPAVFAAVIDTLSLFLLVLPPVVLVLLVGTFYANVGDRRLSMMAVAPALLGSLWTFGFISALGRPVDIVTVIVPIFVLVMGSADGLHFVTHFQDISEQTEDPEARVESTLREVGTPMILTTISTAAGFLSLLATDVRPIRQLGLFAAVGIVFAGLISFFTLSAVMTRVRARPGAHAVLGGRMTGALRWLVRRRWPAPAFSAAVLLFALVFIPQLEVDSDPLFMFTEDHEVRQSFERTEQLFGGATPLVGEFAFDLSDLEGSFARAGRASADLEALPGVRSVFSAVDIVEALGGSGALSPDVLASAVASPLGSMVSSDGLRFMLLPGDHTADDLQSWLSYTDESPDVTTLTGLAVLWDDIARLILRAQVVSVTAALVLVGLMLFAVYRGVRATLVAMIPLLLTIAALLGFIAASGIQLNLITAVASSIVIGVGIDYAIHFVAAIDHARAAGPGFVMRAIDRAGRPIVANALGIAVALTALLLSPFRPHHHLSGVMWVSMTVAALGALVVIPALLPPEGTAEAAAPG